jgi:dienelactone hydrolase
LVAQPSVNAGRVAAIGYCLGGAAALELARGGAGVAAVAVFHSTLPVTRPEDNRNVRGKVLVQTGAADGMVPSAVRTLFEAQMNEAGVDWRMVLYGGVLHAFTVPGASDYGTPGLRYDRDADERSWRAMLDLLGESIGNPGALG